MERNALAISLFIYVFNLLGANEHARNGPDYT